MNYDDMTFEELNDQLHLHQQEMATIEKHMRRFGDPAREILDFLNAKSGRKYKPVASNLRLIRARLNEGATPDEMRQVVAKKCRDWQADTAMKQYLRPATLFNATKYAQYSGELL